MKKLFTILLCSAGLSVAALAQGPGAVPPSPAATASAPDPAAPVAASPAASVPADSSTLAGRIHNKVEQKLRHKGFHFEVSDDDPSTDPSPGRSHGDSNDIPDNVIPLVTVIMLCVFGSPVLIFAVILYFGFSKNRMMHRTVRMMVEKGQPVPAALLNPPPAVRKRSDMRRGVILVMIGVGLMAFFGAVSDGEGGAWAIGMIPFLIGAGYLLVWKLEGKTADEAKADNPPPLP
jgi:uncharacterized protein DUF6249